MGDDIQLANLLVTMQSNLGTKIDGISEQISEVKAEQAEQRRDMTELKTNQAELRQDHAALRQLVEDRTGGIGLTKPQKAALWTAATGLALEGIRHLGTLFSGAAMWIKSGGPWR